MTGIDWRMKLGAILTLAAAAAAVVIVLLASGSSDAAPGAVSHRALAARVAQRLIAAVRLPGAAVAPAAAGAPGGAALADLDRATGPDTVERSGSWTVPASAAAVRAFLEANPPRGTRRARGGSLTYLPTRGPLGLAASRLELIVLPAGPRTSTVHAEARVRWLVARSPAERVPSGARALVITRGALGRMPSLVIRITAPARIARIRTLLDRLSPVQPGRVYHCPARFPQEPVVRFIFRSGVRDGRVLAVATQQADVRSPTTACDAMRFTVAGRARTPLLGGSRLLRQVSALLGRRLWTAPYAA